MGVGYDGIQQPLIYNAADDMDGYSLGAEHVVTDLEDINEALEPQVCVCECVRVRTLVCMCRWGEERVDIIDALLLQACGGLVWGGDWNCKRKQKGGH